MPKFKVNFYLSRPVWGIDTISAPIEAENHKAAIVGPLDEYLSQPYIKVPSPDGTMRMVSTLLVEAFEVADEDVVTEPYRPESENPTASHSSAITTEPVTTTFDISEDETPYSRFTPEG